MEEEARKREEERKQEEAREEIRRAEEKFRQEQEKLRKEAEARKQQEERIKQEQKRKERSRSEGSNRQPTTEEIKKKRIAELERIINLDRNGKVAGEILGIPPQATKEEANKAYRNLSNHIHPDKFVGSPRSINCKEKAREAMDIIGRARDVFK